MALSKIMIAATAAAALTGCAGYENTARNSAIGAAAGAAAGAAIGNNTGSGDAETGALIGAAVGAAGGAAVGCEQDGRCPWDRGRAAHSDLRYDQRAGRYFYVNRGDGCTYWRNGARRSC